ncbi:MAG: flavin reductase family protein [Asticcacaulis sp.]
MSQNTSHLVSSPPPFDAIRFRNLMGRFATGVAVLTFAQNDTTGATTINAFMSVSLEPALVLVSVRTGGRFHTHVHKDALFGISFLNARQQDISHRFASKEPTEAAAQTFSHLNTIPIISDALVQMAVRVQDIHPAGDHQLYVCEVMALNEDAGDATSPLLFFAGKYATL